MELKPCPFCGGEAVLAERSGSANCDQCGAVGPWGDDPVNAWNTRAPDPELSALRARVEGAIVRTVEESGWGDESGDGRIYSLPDEMIGQRVALVKVEG